MRLSDHRVSYPMRDLLKGLVVGEVHRNSGNFSFGTAEALRKRGLIDDNLSPMPIRLAQVRRAPVDSSRLASQSPCYREKRKTGPWAGFSHLSNH